MRVFCTYVYVDSFTAVPCKQSQKVFISVLIKKIDKKKIQTHLSVLFSYEPRKIFPLVSKTCAQPEARTHSEPMEKIK